MARALDLPETAKALDRYGRRASAVVTGGCVLFVPAAGVALVAPGKPWADDLIGALVALGVLVLGAGAGSWFLARRMRRVLGSGAWSAHAAVAVRSVRTTETVVLRSPAGDGLWPLEVVAVRQRYEPLRPGPDGVMWWCGDPTRGGVLAPPGGGALLWTRPVKHRRARRRIVEQAARTDLLGRAAPVQPQVRDLVPPVTGPVTGPVTATVPAPRVSLVEPPESDTSGAPTYARLAAHAGRQAVARPRTGTRRPEADVREVAWWCVRSLRRAAGVGRVLMSLAFCAATAVAAVLRPEGGGLMKLFLVAMVALAALAYSGHRLLTSGIPAVRLMARAAHSPVPAPRRYVLLHDPQDGVPVLVVFAAHGGPHDLPEGLLPLVAPGTAKHPWLGLPSDPAGTVELRGWRDFSADGLPVVVARFEGRALWPAGPYRPAGGAEGAALLARLAPPMSPPALQEEDSAPRAAL
ncbi:hypothetical protein [Streptomyces zaomyceticus]|uniref:hypothetical protein n=1 Tax=Streptomyces zaomyceticus TaxID=68286 RepID=UPI002E129744|nr:hypothetical protein OG237_20850 [Streptomyces zaomyceticus]